MVHPSPNAEAALRATAHTPGPWIAGKRSSVVGWPVVAPSAAGRLICDVTSAAPWPHGGGERAPDSDKVTAFNEESEANARLIAAAPDLLSACVAMVEAENALLADLRAEGRFPDMTSKPWSLVDAMRAAIAKAEGRHA